MLFFMNYMAFPEPQSHYSIIVPCAILEKAAGHLTVKKGIVITDDLCQRLIPACERQYVMEVNIP
jgi:hypothetical protein